MLYGIVQCADERDYLNRYPRYTVGTTVKYYSTANGTNVRYKYIIDGIEYTNDETDIYDPEVPGGRYLVKYSYKKPEYSKIYFQYGIPSKVETPPNGWKKPPKVIRRDAYFY